MNLDRLHNIPKIASLTWKPMSNTSINMGMIGTKNFKYMEKSWGRRYIEKSALDKEKWAFSRFRC